MNNDDLYSPGSLVGLVRPREHCIFTWRKIDGASQRTIEIQSHHCLQCIAELRRQGFMLLTANGKEYPA
jgi:hypothetical protein